MTATPPPQTLLERRRVRSVLDRLLGLRIDLTDWYHMAAGDARLRPLADTFRGMKPPRFPTMFEAVVNAFACQQLSLEVGLELLNRLATISSARFGDAARRPLRLPHGARRGAVAAGEVPSDWVQPSEGPRASRPRPRDHATGTGSGVHRGERTTLWSGSACSNCAASAGGRPSTCCYEASDACTCSLAMMWALRSDWLDGLGVRGRWTTPAFSRAVERWQPYAGLVYFHLLLDGLSQAGALESRAEPASC